MGKKMLRLSGLALGIAFSLSGCGNDSQFSSKEVKVEPYSDDLVIKHELQAGLVKTQKFTVEPKQLKLKFDLNLYEKPEQVVETKQAVRPTITNSFVQGGQGQDYSEDFPVLESGLLDLLIVIDDSQSMEMFQNLIKQRFNELLSEISNTNWQIAVVTTTSSCLRSAGDGGMKVLTSSDYKDFPELTTERFELLIHAGTGGSTEERGIKMAADGLIGDCGDPGAKWTREDSQKAVLLVTDEKNCGSASNDSCILPEERSAQYFFDRAPPNSRVYGLLWFEDKPECPHSGGYDDQYPYEYEKLINKTGGIAGEICQESYAGILKQISKHVSKDVKRFFELSFDPEAGSLVVKLDGKVLQTGYALAGNRLELTAEVGADAQMITVEYRYGGGSVNERFELSSEPEKKTVSVAVNAAPVSNDRFQIVDRKYLQFKTAPPENASVTASFKEKKGLTKEFKLVWPETAEVRDVLVNGELLSPVDYEINPVTQTVTLRRKPTDGAIVAMSYKEEDSKKLDYSVPMELERPVADYRIFDPQNPDKPVAADLSSGLLLFSEDEVWSDRNLKVEIDLERTEEDARHQIALPNNVLPDSVVVQTQNGSDCLPSSNIASGTLVVDCDLTVDEGLQVEVDYVTGFSDSFELGQLPERSLVVVTVNDQDFQNFSWIGTYLVFPREMLKPGDRISVKIFPPLKSVHES